MSTEDFRVGSMRRSLGNRRFLSNDEVNTARRSFYVNSTYTHGRCRRNSEDAPDWMQATMQHYRRKGLHRDEQSFFHVVKETSVYDRERRDGNRSGQFHIIKRRRPRNIWELKDQTFHFEWPKKQEEQPSRLQEPAERVDRSRSMASSLSTKEKYVLPKYALTLKSPHYRQQPTVVKIGHSQLIDSIYVK